MEFNIFLKLFILNSSYVSVNFQGVMVQLMPRVIPDWKRKVHIIVPLKIAALILMKTWI